MRRVLPVLCLTLTCLTVLTAPASAARSRGEAQKPTPAPASGPPHAWLFGSWTGGLFPVLEDQVAQDCRSQQTVLFARDMVAHGSLTGSAMVQRLIETVRTTPTGADFRFTPQPGNTGFGCLDPDELSVLRDSPNAIRFPDCSLFPYPLVRCTGS